MNTSYNFLSLSSKYSEYLKVNKLSQVSISNYLSDMKYFLSWLNFKHSNDLIREKLFTPYDIEQYKVKLIELKNEAHIKRKLSSLRKFTQFCLQEGLVTEVSTELSSPQDLADTFLNDLSTRVDRDSLSIYKDTLTELLKE